MLTIDDAQSQLISRFDGLTDWEDKYKLIIRLGKDMPGLDVADQTEDNKVNGCQSQVWLKAELRDGRVWFTGDSDAFIVKGLVAMLLSVYSGQTPADIIKTQPAFLSAIGLDRHLSQNRTNGLASMVKKIKLYALAFQVRMSSNQQSS
ncbi:MAG: SufE family protein [Bacteroidetes bacterium]|nr:SufE family protein [Bacteroidota bacterium]